MTVYRFFLTCENEDGTVFYKKPLTAVEDFSSFRKQQEAFESMLQEGII